MDEHDAGAVPPEPLLEPTKRCVYCYSLIPQQARLCKECKSYQSKTKNTFTYFGGIAGIVTIAISALVLASNNLYSTIRYSWFWRDELSAVYADYPGDIILSNSGDGDMFVLAWLIDFPGPASSTSFFVNVRVPAHSVESHTFVDAAFGGTAMSSKSGVPSKALIARALIDATLLNAADECVQRFFRTKNSYWFQQTEAAFSASGSHLITMPVESHLTAVSAHTGKVLSGKVKDLVMAFMFRSAPGCTDALRSSLL